MRPRKLFWLIYPPSLAVLVLSLALLALVAGRHLHRVAIERQTSDLGVQSRLLAPFVIQALSDPEVPAVDSLLARAARRTDTRFTLIAREGLVLADTDEDPELMDNHGNRPEILQARATGAGESVRYSRTLGAEMVYHAMLLDPRGDAPVFRLSVPLRGVQKAILAQQREIFGISLGFMLLAALLSLWYTRRISVPIEQMRQAAEQYASGSLSLRLEEGKVEELNSLGAAMNHMAERVDEKVRSLARERNMREALLDSMNEGVIGLDRDMRSVFINRAACSHLRTREARLLRRIFPECLEHDGLRQALESALAEGGDSEHRVQLDGEGTRHYAVSVTPLLDSSEQVIGTLCVLNEITRLKRLETVREDFVANVSHELRTPITSIRGFVETLLEDGGADRETLERFLGIIQRQVTRMNAIIDDLLELSRIEREERDGGIIDRQTIELFPLLDMVRELFQSLAAERKVKLKLDCPADLAWSIDSHRIERALSNLVENAIKYSDPGGQVQIQAWVDGSELQLCVRDQGIGIPGADLPRLFERFYVVDKARSRKMGGTGLGLSIVKHIARAHGGRITVDSEPGKGSCFQLRIPSSLPGSGTKQAAAQAGSG